MYQENEISLTTFLNVFKKEKPIKVGQIGIYQDILTLLSHNDSSTPVRHDFYAKVKAVGVYGKLIEIEVIDFYSYNTIGDDFKRLIENNIPKYVLKKHIKWSEE